VLLGASVLLASYVTRPSEDPHLSVRTEQI
jgi:hypothetical protein